MKCSCDSTGSLIECTEEDCHDNLRAKRADRECVKGQEWKDGCSPCECDDDGVVSCILINCATGTVVGARRGREYKYGVPVSTYHQANHRDDDFPDYAGAMRSF